MTGKRLGRAYANSGDITGDPVIDGRRDLCRHRGWPDRGDSARTPGERLWTADEGALNPPLVVGGSVFVVNDEARLVRLDAATGELIWAVELPDFTKDKAKKRNAIYAHFGPVLAGGRIGGVVGWRAAAVRSGQWRRGRASVDIPGGAASARRLAQGHVVRRRRQRATSRFPLGAQPVYGDTLL